MSLIDEPCTSLPTDTEKKNARCLLHSNVFSMAKQFKKLGQRDQKIMFKFVDKFLPPNHAFYFVIREILQTGHKQDQPVKIEDGIDDASDSDSEHDRGNPPPSVLIQSVRNYHGIRSKTVVSATTRHSPHPTSARLSSDSDSDALDPRPLRKKAPSKKKSTPRDNKRRNVYRLLNSSSVNSVERHYTRALANEQIYRHHCTSHITKDDADHTRLQVSHRSLIYSNNIAGNTYTTAQQWYFHADQRLKRQLHYYIHYPEQRDESEELQFTTPSRYYVTMQLTVHWCHDDDLLPSIQYLRENALNRANDATDFIRRYEHKMTNDQSDNDSDSHHRSRSPSSPPPISPQAAATTAKRFGVLHLLPADLRHKNRHLLSVDELNALTDYVIYAASTKLIKLIDFALLSAQDTWQLLNTILDHALSIYDDYQGYPIQDSLSSILLYDTEKCEKLIGCESERILGLDRYALIWQHGESVKLGDIITFVQSYRRLMCTILSTCCCYFMNRRAVNTRSFIEKHPCLLPKATQGIYFSLFLRMRAGHELLCLSSINNVHQAYSWLVKFDHLRETIRRKCHIPYSDRLSQHLRNRASSLSPSSQASISAQHFYNDSDNDY